MLSLPTIEPPPGAAAGPRGIYPPPVKEKRSLRILLVEDDADSSFVMARLLTSVGHEVTRAGDCASAITAATAAEFDLLLCDLGLPDGNGLDVMAKLRHTDVRGIALTGYGSERDIAASHAAGFDAHLTKPVTLEKIVDAMEKLFP
jgi:CheY-like chemotaxis protein